MWNKGLITGLRYCTTESHIPETTKESCQRSVGLTISFAMDAIIKASEARQVVQNKKGNTEQERRQKEIHVCLLLELFLSLWHCMYAWPMTQRRCRKRPTKATQESAIKVSQQIRDTHKLQRCLGSLPMFQA